MGSGGSMSMFLNPLGFLAKKVGGVGGYFIDPLAMIANDIGGDVGTLIDPARMFEPAKQADVKQAAKVDYDAEARAKSAQEDSNKGKVDQSFEDMELRRQRAIGVKKTSLFNLGKEETTLKD